MSPADGAMLAEIGADICAFVALGVITAAGIAGLVAAWRSEQADRRDREP